MKLTHFIPFLSELYNKSKKRGEERGRQDGILLGLEKKAVEIARKMKMKGRDVSEIMEFTGLTQDEVEAI